MLIWISILLLLDAGLGLWNEPRVEKSLPGWNIRAIAWVEGAIAVALMVIHFW